MISWDQDGEFISRAGEHVPVCRLLDAVTSGLVTSCAVVPPSSGTTNAAARKRGGVAAAAAAPPANGGCDGGGGGAGDVPAAAPSETDEAAELLQNIYALQVCTSKPVSVWGWVVGYCWSGGCRVS